MRPYCREACPSGPKALRPNWLDFGGGSFSRFNVTPAEKIGAWAFCRSFALTLLLTFLMALPSIEAIAQQRMEKVLSSVVRLRAEVPRDARTAASLGQVREGNAVVIDDHGLVLTIGYLILEAQSVSLFAVDGEEIAAKILAYDHESGFGLLRASGPLGGGYVALGDSAALAEHDRVLVIGHGGISSTLAAVIASRREFAGYWEYLLDNAIYTVPPHPNWGGAALVNPSGELVGIGSLIVNDAADANGALPGNMFVPINLLKPIFADLLDSGRSSAPRKPWLGMFTAETYGRVIVTSVTPEGPSAQAGVVPGDVLLEVNGEEVPSMAKLFRTVWSQGNPGATISLKILRGTKVVGVEITSGDRYQYLRLEQRSQ
ncbi:S1C family serine protease [Pelagibius sp. Alg239-R121]|uniref:S1C family serine protease n=1 Tax=Pelagibius sp. Alg239-R121 TaxID=2993448 RepID=UPI0024A689D5|nr:S1C family serine protease [Pelagibius sp. Alg239-R121]